MSSLITASEKRILHLLCRGLSAREIANQLQRSPRTIETHIHHLKGKLNTHKKSELIAYALDNQIFHQLCQSV